MSWVPLRQHRPPSRHCRVPWSRPQFPWSVMHGKPRLPPDPGPPAQSRPPHHVRQASRCAHCSGPLAERPGERRQRPSSTLRSVLFLKLSSSPPDSSHTNVLSTRAALPNALAQLPSQSMTPCSRIVLALLVSGCFAAFAQAETHPIPVKVVVVTMFEVGADTGDQPGELQYWVERDHLDRIHPLAAGYHAVRMNNAGEMAVLTGPGTAHATATIMALGLDPRFHPTHAYWIVAGIAGGSPDRISLGSAAWARWVVDGDLGYEIDARETPQDWTTGNVPLRKPRPFEEPAAALAR